jgi:hypothetical protein
MRQKHNFNARVIDPLVGVDYTSNFVCVFMFDLLANSRYDLVYLRWV